MIDLTMLYTVSFFTWSQPNPERLGTAEKMIGQIQLWAKNADDAITEAKRIAEKKQAEWIALASVDSITGIVLEKILNDPLNPYAVMPDTPVQEEPAAPTLTLVTD